MGIIIKSKETNSASNIGLAINKQTFDIMKLHIIIVSILAFHTVIATSIKSINEAKFYENGQDSLFFA